MGQDEIAYSLFLLAAFGAIAIVVIYRRRILNVQDHEIQSQALFVGGASEALEPRFCCRQFWILFKVAVDLPHSALTVWHEHQGDSQLSWL